MLGTLWVQASCPFTDCKGVHLSFWSRESSDGRSDYLILPAPNHASMTIFLEEISRRYPNEYICIFMDGASAHSLKGLKVPDNMVIEKIPPYSPDVNPTENIWHDIREKFFGNIVFDSIGAVRDRLTEAALAYEADHAKVKSIVGWNLILSSL